ncbi:hypothetical protein BJ138DRAFT_1132965 [Hygrophoropsis aurantiaca]|uniref:Uncharacterized protein n=1 Tax=Hygrophoropsis aurantiaca TaxID=72124 RepID=A0ACB8AND5_9AGAM|nr:hypothetical protein BJ138DRAFT_1132965 [Hygrophoropsis aurantiaca]
MQNAFVVIRTIFLCNAHRISEPTFTYFCILESSSNQYLHGGISNYSLNPNRAAIADYICSKSRPAQVKFECGWTTLMSVIQLAASINVTVNGPPISCHVKATWTTCASASLLVPVSWLTAFVLLTYCFTLIVLTFTHVNEYPNIWSTSVAQVPWFTENNGPRISIAKDSFHTLSRKASSSSTSSEESCAVTRYIQDRWEKLSGIESQTIPSNPLLFSRDRLSVDSKRPNWAQQFQTRRGIDQPFARRPAQSPVAPALPPKSRPRVISTPRDSNYAEVCRESDVLSQYSPEVLIPQTSTIFPPKQADPDLPIPLPRLSEWIRADAIKGITVHTVPPISP